MTMLPDPCSLPVSAQDAADRIDLLTRGLADQWQSMTPTKLDQIAEHVGRYAALFAVEKIPAERRRAAIMQRLTSRTEEARIATGATLTALHAEIAAYLEML
jgi:hypothetical protein